MCSSDLTASTSREDGSFEFTGLAAGTYVVRQTPTKKFLQVTDGGVSASEQLFAATFRQGAGSTGAGPKPGSGRARTVVGGDE